MPQPPEGEYGVIYADPPWRYQSRTAPPNREIENHYPTLDLDAIKEMDVPAAEDCVLYLWATAPKLEEALEVLNAWGFEYRTNGVWDKKRLGLGHWLRIEHELLLIGARGDASPPDEAHRRGSIFHEERGEYSKKPVKVLHHIETAHPDSEKIELFLRDNRVGWEVWGDEVSPHAQNTIENYE